MSLPGIVNLSTTHARLRQVLVVGEIVGAPPLPCGGAGQWVVTPSEGVRRGTRRILEMLESLLALGGLVLLRGEGHRHRSRAQGAEVERKGRG